MLLKSVHQWDIDSADALAKFREDSGQIDQQAERVIYRRSDNIAPGEPVEIPQTQIPQTQIPAGRKRQTQSPEGKPPQTQSPARKPKTRSRPRNRGRYNTAVPYMGRDEFLQRISEDLDQDFPFEADESYNAYDGHDGHRTHGRDIPHRIVVRAVVEHREGTTVRAEFLEVRGGSLAELPNPNAGGIRDFHEDGDRNGRAGFVVEDEAGEMRIDEELLVQIIQMQKRQGSSDEAASMVMNTVDRLNWKDLDDNDDLLKEYFMKEIIGIE